MHRVAESKSAIDDEPIFVSVIVPAFNEAETLPAILDLLLAESQLHQIIVVDDGSRDTTQIVLEPFSANRRVKLITHERNRGKGAAIRTGLEFADGEFCAVQDADLEYSPRDLVLLLQPLLHGEALAVYGCRTKPQPMSSERKWFARGVRVLNLMVRTLYGVRIADEATCYKIFPTALVKALDLQCERFEFCPEVTAKLCRLGVPILEIPIDYSPRSIEEGKKIRFTDAVQAAWILLYWRFARLPPKAYSVCQKLRSERRTGHPPVSESDPLALVSSTK